MGILSYSSAWVKRLEHEHIPEVLAKYAIAHQLDWHKLVRVQPEYRHWAHIPIMCATDMLVLVGLVRMYAPYATNNYLEIGCAFGGTLMLASFASAARLTGVDIFKPFKDYNFSNDNLEEYNVAFEESVLQLARAYAFDHRLKLIKGDMREVKQQIPDGSIDVLFIDGCHQYENASSDIRESWPKVKRGGILVGHDYSLWTPGVMQAVKEWDQYPNIKIPNGSSIFFVEKE